MADQKTDDTKSPLARRGARPFAGPGSAPPASRPFLRPATPSQRATAAPFAPPIVPQRTQSLGAPQPPKPAAPVAPPAPPAPAPVAELPTVSATSAVSDVDPFFGSAPAASEPEPTPASAGPITNEMVALDAFDAFDTVWATAERHATAEPPVASQPAPTIDAPSTPEVSAEPVAEIEATETHTTSPLDESSLGSALDAPHPFSEEIAVSGEAGPPSAPATESTHPTPGFAMPAWLADDHEPAQPDVYDAATEPEPYGEPTPWPIVASDYGYSAADWAEATTIPSADELSPPAETSAMPSPAEQSAQEQRPRFELVDEPLVGEPNTKSATDPRFLHGLKISAALDRLAERVRSGEIDVSSVAPEATDAAVLASVLAALLGGSSSR